MSPFCHTCSESFATPAEFVAHDPTFCHGEGTFRVGLMLELRRIASALEWLAEQGAEECDECRNPGEAASVADLVDDCEESHA